MTTIRPDVVDQVALLIASGVTAEDLFDPACYGLPTDLTVGEMRAAAHYGKAVLEAGFALPSADR